VRWEYHVAPTLSVTVGSGARTMVIDPSMFAAAVPLEDWKACQKDDKDVLVPTNMWPYCPYDEDWHFEPDDDKYSKTTEDLNKYLMQPKNDSTGPEGPPPFAKCKGSHC
jgi:hypothetical protein